MAQPITWRTIAGPSFDNSALGQGIAAFNAAGQGFSRFGEEMFQAQGVADAQHTNRAVLDALRTGEVNPNINPRANAATVFDSLLGLQKGQSDLRTAVVDRNRIRAATLLDKEQTGLVTEQTSELAYKNRPEYRQLVEREMEAGIDAKEADTRASNNTAAYNEWLQKTAQRDDAEGQLIKGQTRDIEQQILAQGERAYQQYLSEKVPPGAQPTPEILEEARMYKEQFKYSPEARAEIDQYVAQKGYLPDSMRASTWGKVDDMVMESKQRLAELDLAAQSERTKSEALRSLYESRGDLSRTIVDPTTGQRRAGTEDELKAEKVGDLNDALTKISARGANVSQLLDPDNKEERDLVAFASSVMPNASLLAPAIQTYIADDGELDVKKFRAALQSTGKDTVLDKINRDRAAQGLPEIKSGETTESTTTAQDIVGAPESIADSVPGAIALQILPASLRPMARKGMEGDVSSGTKVAMALMKNAPTALDKGSLLLSLIMASQKAKSEEQATPEKQ